MPGSRIAAMFDLTGQVAFVTGASAGLGQRFATVLAEAGASVVVAARRRDKLDALVAEIKQQGGKAHAVTLDVSDVAAIPKAIDEAEAAFGLVSILVNNAGIPDAQRAVKMPPALIDAVLDTNLKGPFVLCTEVARRLMAAGKPGRIVNMSSIGAFYYTPQTAAALYSVTKAGVTRMTETLAIEWARANINVNAIAPGFFESEMTGGFIERLGGEEALKKLLETMPRRRICRAEQLDSTLLYLVSPASECVTGTCIRVDDGQSAR